MASILYFLETKSKLVSICKITQDKIARFDINPMTADEIVEDNSIAAALVEQLIGIITYIVRAI